MAAITNTLGPLGTGGTANVGAREDLEDILYRVSPEEKPFTSNIGTTKVTAIRHEWLTEALAAPINTNKNLEGNDLGSTYSAGNVPTRVSNFCQIFEKDGVISVTQDALNLAGRGDETDRQKIIRGVELTNDIEYSMVSNLASVQETGSTPRQTGGALAWATTNVSRGVGGSSGSFNTGTLVVDAATNGTLRTFTEALVKAVLATQFSAGGRSSQAYMSATDKQVFSGFTGIADIRATISGTSMATIYGAADMYVSDFGSITLIPHQFALTRDCLFINPKFLSVGTLRAAKVNDMAKTGDANKFMIVAEKCLIVKNQKMLAVVSDIN